MSFHGSEFLDKSRFYNIILILLSQLHYVDHRVPKQSNNETLMRVPFQQMIERQT